MQRETKVIEGYYSQFPSSHRLALITFLVCFCAKNAIGAKNAIDTKNVISAQNKISAKNAISAKSC